LGLGYEEKLFLMQALNPIGELSIALIYSVRKMLLKIKLSLTNELRFTHAGGGILTFVAITSISRTPLLQGREIII